MSKTPTHSPSMSRKLGPMTVALMMGIALFTGSEASAQVAYDEGGSPWNQRAKKGADAEVPGWFYNLGITGLRVELMAKEPKHLLVKYVFPRSPAAKKVRVGDVIVGAGGARFREEHQPGYGMEVFGARGPIDEFAIALEAAQGKKGRGILKLELRRDGKKKGKILEKTLKVGTKYGAFSPTYPENCPKSDRIFKELCAYLARNQQDDGSFGDPVHNIFAPLALMASEDRRYAKHVEKAVRYLGRVTHPRDSADSLPNWKYTTAGIVMSEYYLATKKKWLKKELEEVNEWLSYAQYTDRKTQVNPKAYESHPEDVPKNDRDKVGGFGHNPGFEGYGPIAMITGQAAMSFALMRHCGIETDPMRLKIAYDFLDRGTGKNGYVWYGDEVAGDEDWADPGRTGVAALANFLAPTNRELHLARARKHVALIGKHPESFPDTHGSPTLGMGWTAAAASFQASDYRKLMDANRYWFALAQCGDRTYYYQPNRDNAGYGNDSRMSGSAVAAFMLAVPKRNLHITGKALPQR